MMYLCKNWYVFLPFYSISDLHINREGEERVVFGQVHGIGDYVSYGLGESDYGIDGLSFAIYKVFLCIYTSHAHSLVAVSDL